MTLESLYQRVWDGWVFDRAYALLPKTGREQERFAVRHVAMHIGKQSGKILALVEPMDHSGREPDEDDTKEMARQLSYMIINVLKLASLLGISATDLLANVSVWEDEHKRS